jgi:hypothetical protein
MTAFARLGAFLALRGVIWAAWRMLPLPGPASIVAVLVALDLVVLIFGIYWVQRSDRLTPGQIWVQRICLIVVAAAVFSTSLDRVSKAFSAPPAQPAVPERLDVEDGVAVFEGLISLASYNALAETLRQSSGLTTLRLNSEGGHIPSARGMARLVQEAKLATQAAGTCASACSLVFMAGTARSLLPGARLGFHAYALTTGERLVDVDAEQTRDRLFMAKQGVAASFLDQAFATNHTNIWFPEPETLRAAGVLKD